MSGKDLIDSVRLSSQICRILSARPPEGFTYELFLDEKGEKISKSRGNGLTIDEWLTYAPPESLSLFMYQKPRAAKRLFFDVIPRQVDDYIALLESYPTQSPAERLENPAWHIHDGHPPKAESALSFGLLLTLASACHAADSAIMWGFVSTYAPGTSPATHPHLDQLVGYAVAYYRDFVKPTKRYRAPSEQERAALADLLAVIEATPPGTDGDAIQNEVYEVGKRHGFANLRDWFKALYEVLLGQSQGPRMGPFIALYGLPEMAALIRKALAGEDLSAA
ncbi:MAG TPA: lysine--tRNA ligase, partial [Alphaproteobacteria bacterium]|nr:lysine--tRNA ligase [Alphaproteobacteria bacterium]